ncbi:hypothetical protein [Burkholderia cenocepacia]|uniref:hypothetical protein n=1 Tax=Burkholderia cenocepacia TaxID=95486 RepID=UPI001237178C|nr:hypothetical protein [Burkholderia cenocepacia]
MERQKIFAGIGSRKAVEVPEYYELGVDLGYAFASAGWRLRSGGAPGMDDAFEQGASMVTDDMDIYLAWKGSHGHHSALYGVDEAAMALAASVHPAWDRLEQGPRKMHARNGYQVLGRTLDIPADVVVCWTADGCKDRRTRRPKTGGTATAIVIAADRGIPVFNLQNDQCRRGLNAFLEKHKIRYRVPVSPLREQVQIGLFG